MLIPADLKTKLRILYYKGILSDKDYERLCKALDQEPCEDAISRTALLQKFYDDVFIRDSKSSEEDYQMVYASTIISVIKSMPYVTNTRIIQETDAEIRNELEEKVEIQEQLIEKQNTAIETQEQIIEIQKKVIEKQQEIIKALERQPSEDCISRQTVLSKIKEVCFSEEWVQFRVDNGSNGQRDFLINYIEQLPSVTPRSKMGQCKDCKYFEYDSFAKVDGIPLIVAHEICSKWGDGCKTKEDGYCFLFESLEESEE